MKSSIVLCAVLWHVSATLILASRAADLSTCFACCMEAKGEHLSFGNENGATHTFAPDFFAKEKDVERCCRQACEGQGPGGCNMPEEIAFFRIGQQLAENAFDPIRINGILYACFEHPPGTYGFDRGEIPQIQNTIPRNLTYSWYTKADNIPTHLPTTFPSIAPTFDGFSSDPGESTFILQRSTLLSAIPNLCAPSEWCNCGICYLWCSSWFCGTFLFRSTTTEDGCNPRVSADVYHTRVTAETSRHVRETDKGPPAVFPHS